MAEPGQSLTGDNRDKERFGAGPATIRRQHRLDDLRLDGKDNGIRHQLARQCADRGVPCYFGRRRAPGRHAFRLHDVELRDRAAGEPAAQHRRPHLAAPDKHETALRPFVVAHIAPPRGQASPTGSIIAEAIAWAGDLPPHTTNWKAG